MHVQNVPVDSIHLEPVVKHVQPLQAVPHVPKQQRHVPNVIQDIICQVEVVYYVQVKSPIVQHVHQPQPVQPVHQAIIHPDPLVPYVPVRNVPHVIQPVELVLPVNQDII